MRREKIFNWERQYCVGGLSVLKTQFSPADNCGVRETVITDREPIKRQGLTDYCIRRFWWYRKLVFAVEIDASWVRVPAYSEFTTLRDASNYVRKVIYRSALER
jgi:hypothetical protein